MTIQAKRSPSFQNNSELNSDLDELDAQLEKRSERRSEICTLVVSHRASGRKIAKSILRKWHAHIAEDDLNSLVDLALCEAALRFNADYGTQFVTFLFYHVRGHLIKNVAQAKKDKDFKQVFSTRDLSEDVIGLTPREEVNSFFIEQEEKSEKTDPESLVSLKQQIEICSEAQSKLSKLDSEVIRRCFLDGEQVIDVSKDLGLSRHYVSRIKTRALKKLKKLVVKANSETNYKADLRKLTNKLTSEGRVEEEKLAVNMN